MQAIPGLGRPEPAPSAPRPARRRARRIGLWAAASSVAAVAAGAFVGQLWTPLGLLAAALVGAALSGPLEGLVGVLGAAVGVPVLRSVGSAILHSPLYLPAALVGLGLGLLLRRRLAALASDKGD